MLIQIVSLVVFLISGFCIYWAMMGYDISLKILNGSRKKSKAKHTQFKYTVTVMIVAHNEEDVIYNTVSGLKTNYAVSYVNSTTHQGSTTQYWNA